MYQECPLAAWTLLVHHLETYSTLLAELFIGDMKHLLRVDQGVSSTVLVSFLCNGLWMKKIRKLFHVEFEI